MTQEQGELAPVSAQSNAVSEVVQRIDSDLELLDASGATEEADQIASRRAIVADLLLTGLRSGRAIGRRLGVSCATAWRDIHAIRQDWLARQREAGDVCAAEAIARLDRLERQYQEGYQRSLDPTLTKTRKRKRAAGADPASPGNTETGSKSITTAGDPRWLDGAKDCVLRRAQIQGLLKAGPLHPSVSVTINVDDIGKAREALGDWEEQVFAQPGQRPAIAYTPDNGQQAPDPQ